MHEKHIYVNEKWSNENKIGIYKQIEVWPGTIVKMSNMAHSFVFSADDSIITKMFSLTPRILFITFRKRYELLDSELTLARY